MTSLANATVPSTSNGKTTLSNPPNARRTMEALREMGYDSYASILDLIDNSIDAQSTFVNVSVTEKGGDIVIRIEDDGIGMDSDTLAEALRLGSETSRIDGDLGKFGMGLVTASIGLSKCLQVATKMADNVAISGGFDLDEIYQLNDFVKWVKYLAEDEFPREQGTIVTLSSTDRISNRNPTQFASILRKKVGQVFRKFIKAGLLIKVNGKAVEPVDPLMLAHAETRLVLETEIYVEDDWTATLRVVDLPDLGIAGNKSHGIVPQNSGFYVLRNNREIIEATTFDFYKQHPDFSHFRAELSFEGFTDVAFHVDIKKASIHPSQGFLDKLRQATSALITESARKGRKRANTGKGQIDHSAAEANIARRSGLIPKPKMQIEKRNPRGNSNGTKKPSDGDRERTPHATHFKTVSGLKVAFEEGDYGPENAFYLVRQDRARIVVQYNREHPFWRELVEHSSDSKVIAILDYLVFAMANSELLVPEHATVVKTNINATLIGLLV